MKRQRLWYRQISSRFSIPYRRKRPTEWEKEPPVSEKRIPEGCGGGTLRKGSGNHPFCRGLGKHLRRLYDAAAERCLGLYSSERHRSAELRRQSEKPEMKMDFYQERGFLISTLLDSEEAYRRIIESTVWVILYYYPTMDVMTSTTAACVWTILQSTSTSGVLSSENAAGKIEHVMKSLHLHGAERCLSKRSGGLSGRGRGRFYRSGGTKPVLRFTRHGSTISRIWVYKGYKPSN